MATLIVEHGGRRKAALLLGRVVIGRRANTHLQIADRTVSRIHAWIGQSDKGYFIVDCGSRVGTIINGKVLRQRKALEDGDEIRIGSAMIKFSSNGTLPEGLELLDLSDRPAESDDGIFVDCDCGAPLWAPWDFAGRIGQCRHCGRTLEMPRLEGRAPVRDPANDTVAGGMTVSTASKPTRPLRPLSPPQSPPLRRPSIFDAPAGPPSPPAAAVRTEAELVCAACQCAISLLEETHKCPECGVTLHAQCWEENLGCSSYGCKQVGILDPHRDQPKDAAPAGDEPSPEAQEPAAPAAIEWDYLFLPLSLAAALIGMLSFGAPAFLTGAALLIYRRRLGAAHRSHPAQSRHLLAASLLICGLATLLGIAFSCYWWELGPAGIKAFRT